MTENQIREIRGRLHTAAIVLARQRALKAIKHQLQSHGLKLSQITYRDLMRGADAYLAQHREDLMAETKPIVERWRLEGFFGKRAKLLSDAQGGKR